MKTGLKTLFPLAGLALAAALLLPAAGLSQEVQSLRGATGVQEANPVPEVHPYQEGGAYARNYRQQPPLIPHRIEKYQIDLRANECVACHDWQGAKKMGAPQISETHYLDRDGNRLDNIAGRRWFCTQCHVPQTDAKPLVENGFTPAGAAR